MTTPHEGEDISINHITVKLMNVFVFGTWLLGSVIGVMYQYYSLQSSISLIANELKIVSEKSATKQTEILKQIDTLTKEQWSKKDHDLWCAKTQQANPNWKCVESNNWRNDG